ncbi:MAG: DUF1844 domain-containing protein [Planctomycetes bacterium]|nr:DUF1844 domain-containing protein [Planctomycetota bacterium]
MSDEGSSRLHIDSDWKMEAAREKERLAKQTADEPPAGGEVPGQPMFADLINMLAMQAAIALGGYSGPGGDSIPSNPEVAKHHIDLLDVLDQKTKGNLSDEEKRALDTVLYELRMQYVQVVGSTRPSLGTIES